MKSDAVGVRERARRTLLGDEHRARQALDQVEERLGGLGIELRGRLVEQQQPRPKRERRGEADALQLAARELADRHARRGARRRRARAPPRPAARSPPGRRRGSRGRTRPRSRPGSSRPGPPDPGRPTRPCPTSCAGRALARVEAGDDDAALRRRRRGSAARARRARAGASTCPQPEGPSSATCSPSSIVSETPSSTGAPAPYAKRSPSTTARATAPPRTIAHGADERERGRARVHGGRGARVRPARP